MIQINSLQSIEEMFEKKFPKYGKTFFFITFCVVILALLAICLNLILKNLVQPVFTYFKTVLDKGILPESTEAAIPTLILILVIFGTVCVLVLYLFGKQLFKKNVSQSSLDKLAELRNEGIESLWAVQINKEEEFEKWKKTKDDWYQKIHEHIQHNFPRSDYLYASHLGVVKMFNMNNAFNNMHLRELCFISRQMDIIEQILNSYRR